MNQSIKAVVFLLFAAISSLGFFSCLNKKHQSNVLLAYSTEHYFSNSKTKDLFKLTLTGDSILSGRIVFEIFTKNKNKIFVDSFSGYDMVDDMKDPKFTLKQKEDTIKKAISLFFNDVNFMRPAATDADTVFMEEFGEGESYEDIKADTSAVGFSYAFGVENLYYIAYSKKEKKVVTYLSTVSR